MYCLSAKTHINHEAEIPQSIYYFREKKNLNIQGRCETLVVILARKMHLKNNPIQM